MPLYPETASLSLGGRKFSEAELKGGNMVYLIAADTGTGNYNTFREFNGTAGYVVPGGKTLRILALRLSSNATTGSQYAVKLLYGDTDVGFASAAAPTTPVYMGGSSAANYGIASLITTGGASQAEDIANFTVPTGKYPAFLGKNGSITVIAIGILE